MQGLETFCVELYQLQMATEIATNCCNVAYDIFTIFISLADVTTDVIVLIDFYNKDRMQFFGISLAILILAQCSYSIAFAAKYDTISRWNLCQSISTFCCCLPFGTIVAFIMYFGSEESGLQCFNDFLKWDLDLDTGSSFDVNHNDSKMMKFVKRKLDKHLGFILEAAVEAFPQSLLQIIAIVYFQEANYISIISILLSMFSVMSKSLILSQGIEKYTFIWTWLCVVTDFFGIFFTLSWVFYTNDYIHGDFLGYFSIFGEIWLWKFAISTALPVAIGLVFFFGFAYWFWSLVILCEEDVDSNATVRFGLSCLFFLFC